MSATNSGWTFEGETPLGRRYGYFAKTYTLYLSPLPDDPRSPEGFQAITDPFRLAGILRDVADALVAKAEQ